MLAALALIAASAIWLVLSATIVLWPAATLGLAAVAMALHTGRIPAPRAVVQTVRRHLRAMITWGVVNAAVLALLFALDRDAPLVERLPSGAKTLVWLATIVWLFLQLYAVPLLLVQRDGRMLSAWRSAVLLVLSAPMVTLLLGLATALIAGATRTWPLPMLLIAPGLLAWLGCVVVNSRLRAYGYSPRLGPLLNDRFGCDWPPIRYNP